MCNDVRLASLQAAKKAYRSLISEAPRHFSSNRLPLGLYDVFRHYFVRGSSPKLVCSRDKDQSNIEIWIQEDIDNASVSLGHEVSKRKG